MQERTFNLELPDGRIIEGIPIGTSKEQIREKLAARGLVVDEPRAKEPLPDVSIFSPPKNKAEQEALKKKFATIAERIPQGASFGFSDEMSDPLVAGVKSVASGKKYGDALKETREETKARLAQQEKDFPGTVAASEILGGLLTLGGAGAAKTITQGSLLSKLLRGGGTGAATSALYGAGTAGDTTEERARGAAEGGAIGLLGGAALGLATPALSKGIESVADKIAMRQAIKSGEISITPKAYQKIVDRLRADFPDPKEFQSALSSYFSKSGKTLVETGGGRTANLAEGAAMYPAGGARTGEFFKEAIEDAPDTLKRAVSKTVSSSDNYLDALDDIVKKGREKAAPLYSEAFKNNQNVSSPAIDRLLQTPEGKSALAEAVKNMRNEMSLVAKPDPELTAMMREMVNLGKMKPSKGGVGAGLKLKTLDYVKRSMDDTIRAAIKAGDDAEVRRIGNIKRALVDEIDALDASGSYAKARKVSGDYLSNKEALERGADFLREDPEIIKRYFKEIGGSEKDAYRKGVVKAIRDNIDNKLDGRNVTQIFQKKSVREKLNAILPAKEYSRLMDEAHTLDNIYRLRNQMTGNSRTTMRQVAAEEFDDESQKLIEELVNTGVRRTAFKRGIQYISGKFNGMNDKLAGEVADILYETDPKKKYQIVKTLVNEANATKENVRKTEAAKKLAVFYRISDALSQKKMEGK